MIEQHFKELIKELKEIKKAVEIIKEIMEREETEKICNPKPKN